MAKTATFKVYNGSAWEELTFTPSSHEHTIANITSLQTTLNNLTNRITALEDSSGSGGGSVDLSGYIPLTGTTTSKTMTGNIHFPSGVGICYERAFPGPSSGIDIYAGYSFDTDGWPIINSPDGRILGISTEGFDEDTEYYTFPETGGGGTVVLEETATNHHKFKLLGTKTLTASGYMDLSTTNWANYNELMIIVRATAAATIGIDDATTASSSGFGASKAVSGTSYTKIMMNKTSDSYYAWDVGGSLLWTSSTTYKYIRAYTTASSISVTIKVYGR